MHEQANARDIPAALAAYRRQPQSQEALYRLLVIYLELYQNDRARDIYNKLSAIDAAQPYVRWAQAELLRRQHKLKESEQVLRELIRCYPDFMLPRLTLGFIRYMQARFDDASRLALSVIRKGPAYIDTVYYPRAYVLYAGAKGMIAFKGGLVSKLVNGPKVFSSIRKAEKLRSNCSAAWWGFGNYYLFAPRSIGGDVEKAKMYLQRTIAAEPLFPDPYVRMAQVHQAEGDLRGYGYYLGKALKLDPGNELAKDIMTNTCNFICVDKGMDR